LERDRAYGGERISKYQTARIQKAEALEKLAADKGTAPADRPKYIRLAKSIRDQAEAAAASDAELD